MARSALSLTDFAFELPVTLASSPVAEEDALRKPLEIERLRREMQNLKAKRDILKKAVAGFAKEAT
jgi:transposase-like protein